MQLRMKNAVKRDIGNSMAQYGIIIALVALALVPVFLTIGQTLVANFSNMTDGLSKGLTGSNTGNTGGNNTSSTSTPQTPTVNCTNDTCDVALGPYNFQGVPQNLSTFVETSGSAAGTTKIADLVNQIAQELQASGNQQGYEDYKRLANLIHLQGDILEHIENKASTNPSYTEFNDFYFNKSLADSGYNINPQLANTMPNLAVTDKLGPMQTFSNEIGYARYAKTLNGQLNSDDINKYPAYAIVDQFDKIMANSTYPPELKKITEELYRNAADVSSYSSAYIYSAAGLGGGGSAGYHHWDPITGKDYNDINFNAIPPSDILHPKYSLNQNLTGSLTCAAGNNTSTGTSCH